jgi:cytochrome c
MEHSLSRLADLLAAPNADQVVRGMRLHLQTNELLPNGGKPLDARY